MGGGGQKVMGLYPAFSNITEKRLNAVNGQRAV